MAIFRRDPSARSQPAAAAIAGDAAAGAGRRATAAVTVIASGTRIEGAITGPTEVQIHGEVAGEVTVAGLVLVAAGGSVSGPIGAQVVRVVGRVTGNLTAAELVEVGPAGNVDGDIAAPRVVIAEGAFFTGSIDMKGDDGRQPRRPAKPEHHRPPPATVVAAATPPETAAAAATSATTESGSQ